MTPLNLAGMKLFGAPKGWDPVKDGPCHALPVDVKDGVHTSIWAFSDLERKRIADGENLALHCVSLQPPVMLNVVPISDVPIEPQVKSWWQRLIGRFAQSSNR